MKLLFIYSGCCTVLMRRERWSEKERDVGERETHRDRETQTNLHTKQHKIVLKHFWNRFKEDE